MTHRRDVVPDVAPTGIAVNRAIANRLIHVANKLMNGEALAGDERRAVDGFAYGLHADRQPMHHFTTRDRDSS